MIDILLAMGFEKADVQKAIDNCESVEDAVHFIMMRQNRTVIERVGEHIVDSGLYDYMQPAASGLASAAGRVSEQISSWISWPERQEPVDVTASLLALGYQESQAQAASRRCSSVEAAIEWISANPEIEA